MSSLGCKEIVISFIAQYNNLISFTHRQIGMILVVLLLLQLQLLLVLLELHRQLLLVLHRWRGLGWASGCWIVRLQGSGQEVIHIVIVCQSTSGRRNSKVTVLGQDHILRTQTHFVFIRIVVHTAVEEHRQHIVVVLDLGLGRVRLVTEVPEAAGQGLCSAIVIMIKRTRAVVQHGHDVGIVVLVVVVEGVEEEAEADPLIRRAINISVIIAMLSSVPESKTISAETTTSCDPELDLHLPPVEVGPCLGPNGTLLTTQ